MTGTAIHDPSKH